MTRGRGSKSCGCRIWLPFSSSFLRWNLPDRSRKRPFVTLAPLASLNVSRGGGRGEGERWGRQKGRPTSVGLAHSVILQGGGCFKKGRVMLEFHWWLNLSYTWHNTLNSWGKVAWTRSRDQRVPGRLIMQLFSQIFWYLHDIPHWSSGFVYSFINTS